ncbi:hypothetical protein F4775DRAFT_60789 [Biscogniauxia sp. FL1348]|nr:hypothetical protein F4775DRAFT_60789 [Biscogniauxia sp. FL1348]
MPREGSGRAHNAQDQYPETQHDIIHGAAGDAPKDSHVERADKTAPLPEHEHGQALEGLPGAAGHSQGLAQGPDRGQGGRGSKN